MEMEKKENSSKSMKPHIAILPSPGMGHIIPLLEFAKRLVNHHGFHVSFLVFTSGASPAQNQLLNSSTLPLDLQIIHLPPVEIPAIFDDYTEVIPRLLFIVKETITKSLKSTLLNLHNLPKALIIDMFCVDAFDTAKEEELLSLPTYLFFTASAALLTLMLYFPTFDETVNGVYSDLPETFQVPGCNPMLLADLTNQVFIREGIQNIKRLKESAGIITNTWDELEQVSLSALRETPFFLNLPTPPIYPIGPLIKEAVDDDVDDGTMSLGVLGDECLTWLNNQPLDSVLFVSFGSGGTLSAEQITELAWGLEHSRQRFIWVARNPNGLCKSGAFFNVGSTEGNDPMAYLPKGFLERTKEVGKVVPSWAPQVAVLGHQATGGFLSHCGWNSILESIVHGVPMIAWPLFGDQLMNATMISKQLGMAVRPVLGSGDGGVVGRDEIERVVRMVMEGEEGKAMRFRAKELQDSAKKTQVGASHNSLSSVVRKWKMERQE